MVVFHDEIPGKGEDGARAFRKIGVFEKRGIVAPGRKDHVEPPVDVHVVQDMLQKLRIVAVVFDVIGGKRFRTHLAGDGAGDKRVGRTGRNAKIVFQHEPSSVPGLHQVYAGNVGEHAVGRTYAFTLGKIPLGGIHKGFGNDFIFKDVLFAVNVGKKQVESFDALRKTLFQIGPLFGVDDAGNGIKGKELLLELPVLVNSKAHAIAFQPVVHSFTAFYE